MSRLHLEVLSDQARKALDLHASFADSEEFYLAGGTALALQFGHRRSVDFDWFRTKGFDPVSLARGLTERGVPFELGSTARATLHGRVEGTQVSFIEFRYPTLAPLLDSGLGFKLAAPLDIGTMKLSAVAQRGARKDFFDLVALGRAGFGPRVLLDAYQRRFAVRDLSHVLAALTYFDDADKDTEPVLDSRENWSDVKKTIRGWVKELAGK